MERVNRLFSDPRFRARLAAIADKEKARAYCRHDLAHFLDVARIAALIAADARMTVDREIVYAAALLHDLGRAETEEGHAEASARIAGELLPDCGFDEAETGLIAQAIGCHGASGAGHGSFACEGKSNVFDEADQKLSLSALLSHADRLSRPCRFCSARDTCYWETKNERVEY